MAENTGDLERGDPFGTIDFHVVNRNRQLEIFQTDCTLALPLIGGHKLDLAEMLKVEGQVQTWKYNGQILQDDRSLLDYGIDGTETVIIKVTVS